MGGDHWSLSTPVRKRRQKKKLKKIEKKKNCGFSIERDKRKIVTLLDRMSVRRVIGLEEGWKELEDGGIKKLKVGEKKKRFFTR